MWQKFGRKHETGLWSDWSAELARRPANTVRSFKVVLKSFLLFHRKEPESIYAADFLCAAKQSHIAHYIADCKKRGLAPGTIANRLAILSSCFKWLKENGYRDEVPHFEIPRHTELVNPTKRIDPADVMPAIAAELQRTDDPAEGLELAAWYALAFFGALRRSEICALRLCDVQDVDGRCVIYLQSTKSHQSAAIAISEHAAWVVWAWHRSIAQASAGQSDAALFRYSESFYYKKFSKRFGAAPHAARACAISQLLQSGCSLDRIKEFSRHKSIDTLYIYDKRLKSVTDSAGLELSFEPKKPA